MPTLCKPFAKPDTVDDFVSFQLLISVLEKFTAEMKVGDTKSAVRRVNRISKFLEYLNNNRPCDRQITFDVKLFLIHLLL